MPKIGKILPKIKVYFGQAQSLDKIWQENGKLLTQKLEKEYNIWINKIKTVNLYNHPDMLSPADFVV